MRSRFPPWDYSRRGPIGALYANMDGELFLSWMTKLFIPYTAQHRPTLLIIDGHVSHITIDVIDVARENDIILYCLPPHTTNILQPLYVVISRPVKQYFAELTGNIKLATLGTTKVSQVNKTNFTAIFREAFEHAMTLATLGNSFRKCGIYQYNPDAIDKSRLMCSSQFINDMSTPLHKAPSTPNSSHPSIALVVQTTPSALTTPATALSTSHLQ